MRETNEDYYSFIDNLPDDLFCQSTTLIARTYSNDIEALIEEITKDSGVRQYDNSTEDSVYSSDIQKNEQQPNDCKQGNTKESQGNNIVHNKNTQVCVYSSDIHITDRQVEILRAVAGINARAKEAEDWRQWRTGVIYQQEDFRNDIGTPEELMDCLKGISRKAGKNLERLYEASRVFERYMGDAEVIEEVGIATTGGLARLYSKSTAAELIKLAERVDLLRCTNTYYCPSYGGGKRKNGTARRYIINPQLLDIVRLAYLGEQASTKPQKQARKERKVLAGDGGTTDKPEDAPDTLTGRYDICFASNLHLPADLTDEQVRAAIYARYPQLNELQALRERINREYYAGEPMLELRQRVKITRGKSGVVSKVGTRCTSPLCQLRANDIPEGYEGLTRQIFLRRYYEGREYYEYDVKSSIYRVAYFLRTGVWVPANVDFYSLMSPYEFADKQARADYKAGLAMQLYFGGSPAKITANLYRNVKGSRKAVWLDKKGYSREEVLGAIAAGQAYMFAVVGQSIGSEVFLHEGGIYLMLLERLLGMGLQAVSVYDEFISDDPRLGELCEALLPVVAQEYRQRWCC